LQEFLAKVDAICAAWAEESPNPTPVPWFRGHQNESWLLEPSLLRRPYLDSPSRWEDWMHDQYKARALAFLDGRPPTSALQWLFLMQHHGLPTRLHESLKSFPDLVVEYVVAGEGISPVSGQQKISGNDVVEFAHKLMDRSFPRA
jgi:hypothetical protein